jgi:thymidylate kinase
VRAVEGKVMIICITGGDASGKATQSKILTERLVAALFAFPDYETTVGKAILGNLKSEWAAMSLGALSIGGPPAPGTAHDLWSGSRNALVLQSLMNTNRIERSDDLKYAARRGHVVLDRYDVDAIIYGLLDGLEPAWLEAVNAQLPVKPDLYILLDASVETGFARRPERRDRYESDRKRMEEVRIAYLKMFVDKHEANLARARGDGKTRSAYIPGPAWRIVDGDQPIEAVAQAVWNTVSELL